MTFGRAVAEVAKTFGRAVAEVAKTFGRAVAPGLRDEESMTSTSTAMLSTSTQGVDGAHAAPSQPAQAKAAAATTSVR